jgi:hypothetical protein
MWNRQREAEAARERLSLAGEAPEAPNRNPPPVADEMEQIELPPLISPAAAAE